MAIPCFAFTVCVFDNSAISHTLILKSKEYPLFDWKNVHNIQNIKVDDHFLLDLQISTGLFYKFHKRVIVLFVQVNTISAVF